MTHWSRIHCFVGLFEFKYKSSSSFFLSFLCFLALSNFGSSIYRLMYVISFTSKIICLIFFLCLSFCSRSCREETFFYKWWIFFVFDRFVCTTSQMLQTNGRVSVITSSHRNLMIPSKVAAAAAAAAASMQAIGTMENVLFWFSHYLSPYFLVTHI